jgi:hypothetical protein
MWGKNYESDKERKRDQQKGFLTCSSLNMILGGIGKLLIQPPLSTHPLVLLLPWLANLGIVFLALIFRPQFAVGYFAFIATVLIAGVILGILFIPACLAALAGVALAGNYGAVFCGGLVILGGLFIPAKILWPQIKQWWSGDRVT